MLRLCLYKSYDEYEGELRERIRAGLAVEGIDAAELDDVISKAMQVVMNCRGRE